MRCELLGQKEEVFEFVLKKFLCVVGVMTFLAVLHVPIASAEWYADLYGGGSFTQKSTVEQVSSLGVTVKYGDTEFNPSGTVGGRAGYWFDQLPYFGMGLDVFWFQPSIDRQNVRFTSSVGVSGTANLQEFSVRTVGVGFDILRLRMPLMTSEQFPHGQLQPYVSVGPAVFFTRLKDTNNFAPNNQSVSDTSLGVKVGTGVNFQVTKLIGLFGEYRFTHFKADGTLADTTPPASQETVRSTFNTHHFIVGISFRFN